MGSLTKKALTTGMVGTGFKPIKILNFASVEKIMFSYLVKKIVDCFSSEIFS